MILLCSFVSHSSAALIIAYIMETFGLTYKKAHRYVLQQRYCINPNEGFARQLVVSAVWFS